MNTQLENEFYINTSPLEGVRSIPSSVSVCRFVYMSVCPLAYLKHRMFLYEIFCARYLCALLGPPLTIVKIQFTYFRFCG